MADNVATVLYPSRFGNGWIAFEDGVIVELGLPGSVNPFPVAQNSPSRIGKLADALAAYWAGGALPPVSDEMFQASARTQLTDEIYRRVAAIEPGTTMTYAAVAGSVGRPGAARAVGAAMAANRFAPVIPCHRVVGTDGSLRGYAGGLEVKRYLINMEAGLSDG